MTAPLTRPNPTPEQRAAVLATREEALHHILRGTVVVALLALVTNALSSLALPDWGGTAIYGVIFVILLGLTLGRRLPFALRGGIFVGVMYAVSVVSLVTLGLGGAGRVYLLGFTVITMAVFGTRAGLGAAVAAVLTWLATAAAFSLGWLAAGPNDSALILNWVAGAASLLLVMVAVMIPQRLFLASRQMAAGAGEEMARLEAAQAALAAQAADLEAAHREAREAEAQQAALARAAARRASLLALNAEVAQAMAGLNDVPALLNAVVQAVSQRFNFYHAGVFLLDDAREWAVLRAANSQGGQTMLARGHRLRVGQEGLVGYVTSAGRPRIALDVGADAVHFANPDLPETHSEMAVPLRARGVIVGALDVQSTETNAFTDEDASVLQSLADQIGLAIENARLLQETQRRLEELQALQQATRRTAGVAGAEGPAAFHYDGVAVRELESEPAASTAEDGQAAGETLTVPLQFGDQRIGVLELKRSGEMWSADDMELTTAIADRMALALESAQLFEQTRARALQLAALSEAAIELTGPQFNTDQALEQVVRGAQRLFAVDDAGVWLPVDEEELELRVTASVGQGSAAAAGQRVKIGEGLAGQVYASGQALRAEPGRNGNGQTAALVVPMTWQGQVQGVLALTQSGADTTFSADDERIALLYAAQSASTLENARLFAETQQRLTELGAINTISQALTAQSSLEDLLPLVGEKVFETFDSNNGFVALYDSRTGEISFPYFVEAGERLTVEPRQLGQGLTSIVIQSREPLLINRDSLRRTTELGALQQGAPAQSWLGVPITSGADVIGVLCVQDIEHEGRFSESDARLLTTIAANVGVAIQNARLFAQTQQRAEELAVINDISQGLSGQLDEQTLVELVVDKLRQAFNRDSAYLALYDRATQMISIPYMIDSGARVSVDPFPLGEGLTSLVIQQRAPLLIERDAERRVAELGAKVTGRPARSFLAVPVQAGEEVLGVISVQDLDQEGAFGEADARLLSTVAANVGVALQSARLFAETQRRAEQLATAADVSRTAISATDPDALIVESVELIRDRFANSTGVYYAALFLVDAGSSWARLRHATGEAGRVLLARQHRLEVGGNSMVGWATANRQPRIALDVGAEPVRFANPLLPETRSEMALPLVVGDTVLGALDVQSTRANAFTQADVAVLQTMTDQLAIALRNAQLLTATQRTQAFLDSVIENLPVTLSVKDAYDLRYVRWNRASEAVLGIARDEILGRSDHEFFATDAAGLLAEDDRRVLAGMELVEVPEQPVETRGRGARVLHTRKIPIADETGKPQYLLSISEDITERKAADERLRAAEERYRSLVEQLPAVIYAMEVAPGQTLGRMTYISPPVQSLLGYSPEEWLADPNLWVSLLHPEDRERVLRAVAQHSVAGTTLDLEYRSLTRDGRVVWFHNQAQAVPDPAGRLVSTRGIMFDITARRQAEAELKAAQETAQRRAQLLAAAADVARAMTVSLNREELLATTINLIRDRFGFYHASVFTVDPGSQVAVLRESTGAAGAALKARRHKLGVGSRSLVGTATATRQPVVVQDVTADPNHFKNPLLPDTRAEAVVPLLSGETVVGALDVQSDRPFVFGVDEVAILVTIADQLAVALQNARLFDQTARQARREALVVEITSKIRAAGDMDAMLRTAVTELRQALGAGKAAVRLALPGAANGPSGADKPASGGAPDGTGELKSNGSHADLGTNGSHGKPAGANGAHKHGPSEGSV